MLGYSRHVQGSRFVSKGRQNRTTSKRRIPPGPNQPLPAFGVRSRNQQEGSSFLPTCSPVTPNCLGAVASPSSMRPYWHLPGRSSPVHVVSRRLGFHAQHRHLKARTGWAGTAAERTPSSTGILGFPNLVVGNPSLCWYHNVCPEPPPNEEMHV